MGAAGGARRDIGTSAVLRRNGVLQGTLCSANCLPHVPAHLYTPGDGDQPS